MSKLTNAQIAALLNTTLPRLTDALQELQMTRKTTTARGRGHTTTTSTGGGTTTTTDPAPTTTPTTGVPTAPASVATPVVGTSLQAVWNLQATGATGPSTTPTKTVAANWAALTTIGAVLDNYGNVWFNPSAGQTWTVDGFDFTGFDNHVASGFQYGIRIGRAGTVNFTNCKFGFYSSLIVGSDINQNGGGDGLSNVVTFTRCDFNDSTCFNFGGSVTFTLCRLRNQRDSYGSWSFNGTALYMNKFDRCYMTGGGCAPATNQHVECWQAIVTAGLFIVTDCLQILTDGQASVADWGSGWTAVWSGCGTNGQWINCIIGCIAAVNANAANPNVIGRILAYGDGANPSFTNCVLEAGTLGYTGNITGGVGGPDRPTVSGCRSYVGNVALVLADFG
jgi:hypothetical protein